MTPLYFRQIETANPVAVPTDVEVLLVEAKVDALKELAPEDLSVDEWRALCHGKLRKPGLKKEAAESLEQPPFRTETTAKGNNATRFYYDAIPGMDPKQRERWAALDTNNDGSIDIEEIGEKRERAMTPKLEREIERKVLKIVQIKRKCKPTLSLLCAMQSTWSRRRDG